jgi:hypothetical protein
MQPKARRRTSSTLEWPRIRTPMPNQTQSATRSPRSPQPQARCRDIYDAAQRAKQSESNATCQANCTLAIHNRYQWIRPYNKWPMQILVYDAQTDQNHRSQCVEDCSAEAKVADQLFKVANKQHHRSPATAATGQTTLGQVTQNRSNSKHTAHRTHTRY